MNEEASSEQSESPEVQGEMLWYVLKVQSNRENTIKEALKKRVRREGLEEFFGDIIVPVEKVVETKGGKKRVSERKLYPGYIMVNMILNDESWYLVRETGGVGDFTGAAGKPMPMAQSEIDFMLGKEETQSTEPAKLDIGFAPGEVVKISEGSFQSFEGVIDSIDETSGKITVLIEIFGRSTPAELEYWQLEKV